jgi:uDENN domain
VPSRYAHVCLNSLYLLLLHIRAKEDTPKPRFFSFVFTNVDGRRTYAACLTFYEPVALAAIKQLTQQLGLDALLLEGGSSAAAASTTATTAAAAGKAAAATAASSETKDPGEGVSGLLKDDFDAVKVSVLSCAYCAYAACYV